MMTTNNDRDKSKADFDPEATGVHKRPKRPAGVRALSINDSGIVARDLRGSTFWKWKIETAHPELGESTVDLLKCLDADALSLEDTRSEYNPYASQGRLKKD